MGLVFQLSRLVQTSQTPFALLYVANHLTWGDPTLSFCFLRALFHIRCEVFHGLLHCSLHAHGGLPHHPLHGGAPLIHAEGGMPLLVRQGVPPGMPLAVGQGGDPQTEQTLLVQQQIRRELDIRQEAQRLLLQTDLRTLIEKMVKEKSDLLCKKIREGSPLERFLAVQVVGRRRLPLEKDLIEVLHDPDKMVRQAAHDALVRICRGTDFGPKAGVSKRGIGRSVEQWRNWLALQESVSRPPAAKPISGPASLEFVTVAAEVPRRSEDLGVLAESFLNRSDDLQEEAREALTRRLTRLTAAALRDKLQDDSPDVRCAAALACGRKIAKDNVPDLLQLLDDPELDVVLSARVALTELTGEDFGPTRDEDRQGRIEAAEAWRKWWKERLAKR